jgi:hypothetical protein
MRERGCSREFDEAEMVEDRSAGGGGVDLEVAEASGRRHSSSEGHERAKQTESPPGRQGATTPQAGEICASVEFHPPGSDRRSLGKSDRCRSCAGLALQARQQGSAHGGVISAEYLVMHRHKRLDAFLAVDDA